MCSDKATASSLALDRIVAQARRDAEQRDKGYRERALKMYPWICGRCAREFTRNNLSELTVHHRNHDHGHSRYTDYTGVSAMDAEDRHVAATSNPFADLKSLLKR
jgi:hypothetical protein